jgi:uncharacterized membrane protein SirB2
MSSYFILKFVHVATAFISIVGFTIRGIWMIQSSPILQKRWIRIVPHINDTVLLISAIALVIVTSQYPGPVVWINAKIAALLIYIILGTVALKRGKTKLIRIISGVLALLTFSYIGVVAFSKNSFIFI